MSAMIRDESGHIAKIFDGACMDGWGAGLFKILVGDNIIYFIDSDRFGPLVESRNGVVKESQPGSLSAFWRAHYMWVWGGRKLDGDACLWREPNPGQYWTDPGGVRHFISDPEWEPLGYVQVPRP